MPAIDMIVREFDYFGRNGTVFPHPVRTLESQRLLWGIATQQS